MEKLERINQFFVCDLEVKKILHSLVPNEIYAYNSDSIIEYSDKISTELKILKYYIVWIMNSFNINKLDYVNELFDKYENELAEAGLDFSKLKKFYQTNLSNMSPIFIDKVNSECVGYTFAQPNLIDEAKTVNEILHFLHHYIINNEKFYQDVPQIEEKNGIFLRGKESDIAREIYDIIPYDMDIGVTDIISLPNKILLMVRDKGHALTIEIEKDENNYTVRYFIPKICNYLMVNNLKGVKKVQVGDKFTVGLFDSVREKLANDILELIDGVPMDDHMEIEGGSIYEAMKNLGRNR